MKRRSQSKAKKSGAGHISELYAEFTPEERQHIEKGAKKTKETITRSSGNVFADLALPNPEELQLKARLTHLILDILEQRNLTPQQAAKALGIKRAEVSKLTGGGFDDFTGGQLLYFLSRLEHRVVITVYENGKQLPRSEIVIAASQNMVKEVPRAR
jgi:predicted XRE-type DNA-binding protein